MAGAGGANRRRWQVPSTGRLSLLLLHNMQHSTILSVPDACAAWHGNACPVWQGCIKSLQLGASCHIGNTRLHTLQIGISFALMRSPRKSFTLLLLHLLLQRVPSCPPSLTHANQKPPHAGSWNTP
eukprot:361631-Chlamydomonas_euryale.AAC.6